MGIASFRVTLCCPPGGHQMAVVRRGAEYGVRVYRGERVNRHLPSVDVHFSSCAQHLGRNALGVLLTGMGNDGAQGMLRMKEADSYTIAQDESSSVVFGMPKEAYLAPNASALLEDFWAQDDTLWVKAPSRRVYFDDMLARRKAELLATASARPPFQERDFACYTDDEIRAFAFDVRKLFLTERAWHLAICTPLPAAARIPVGVARELRPRFVTASGETRCISRILARDCFGSEFSPNQRQIRGAHQRSTYGSCR